MWILCALIPCLLLVGCGGKKPSKKSLPPIKRHSNVRSKSTGKGNTFAHIQAKLTDVPTLPLNAKPIARLCSSEPHMIMMGYSSTMTCNDIIAFYQYEMERFGWDFGAQFKASEYLLQFCKPDRNCTISIRPGSKNHEIVMFVGIKEGYTPQESTVDA